MYTFSEVNGYEILRTVDTTSAILEGWQEHIEEYPDSTVTDKFYIVSHLKSETDTEGKFYEWYRISNHTRQIDKSKAVMQTLTDAILSLGGNV